MKTLEPYCRAVSSSSQGWGTPTYTGGDYASTHAYGVVSQGIGINSSGVLSLVNNAEFRTGVVAIAGVLPSEAPADQPWFHGEAAATERQPWDGEDLTVSVNAPRIFKGITAYHYVMMTDLLLGAAGTPLKWNDAKEFGEMKARAADPGGEQYNNHFDPANYQPNYFAALDGHRQLLERVFSAGLAPWSVTSRGDLPGDGSTAALWARDDSVAICWIYKVADAEPPGTTIRDFGNVVPPGGNDYRFVWVDPWSGSEIASEDLPAEDPGGGAEWIGAVDVWTGNMASVLPTGFDTRQREDVFVIIQKLN
jgi:hypothetical protein